MRLHGIWLYGALTLTTLAIAGFFYEQKLTVILSIMAMSFAYAAEFIAQEEEWERFWAPKGTQILLVLLSIGCGLAAFVNIAGTII